MYEITNIFAYLSTFIYAFNDNQSSIYVDSLSLLPFNDAIKLSAALFLEAN
jgi:hypothetical protein